MMRKYTYKASGTGAGGLTWSTEGEIEGPSADVVGVFNEALRDTFSKLTQGRAVYGEPGKGCSGPYEVMHLLLDRVPQ